MTYEPTSHLDKEADSATVNGNEKERERLSLPRQLDLGSGTIQLLIGQE